MDKLDPAREEDLLRGAGVRREVRHLMKVLTLVFLISRVLALGHRHQSHLFKSS
jgi:hypothetical protein